MKQASGVSAFKKFKTSRGKWNKTWRRSVLLLFFCEPLGSCVSLWALRWGFGPSFDPSRVFYSGGWRRTRMNWYKVKVRPAGGWYLWLGATELFAIWIESRMVLNAAPWEDIGLYGTATREMICSRQKGRRADFPSDWQTASRGGVILIPDFIL